MPVFVHEDISINYEIVGSGPRVLFFNGSGATLESAALFIGALAQHAKCLRTINAAWGKLLFPMARTQWRSMHKMQMHF